MWFQTQIFHTLYYTDHNVLLGAPTGSGKTIAAELAIFRVFRETPKAKVVYIAPLKALVRERIEDWKVVPFSHHDVFNETSSGSHRRQARQTRG